MVLRHKYSLFYFLLIFCNSILSGQNLFTSNLYNNIVFNNPSVASYNEYSIFQLNYRNQWPIDGIYNSYGVSYFQSVNKLNSNFGGVFTYDRQLKGAVSNISTGLNYSFKLQISRNNYLLLGLMGNYNYQSLNYNNLVFENPTINPPENQTLKFPSANFGTSLLLDEKHLIGISLVNIFSNPTGQNNPLQLHINYLSQIEIGQFSQSISYIEPLADIGFNKNYINFMYGANVGFDAFKTGLLINQTGLNINAISFLLGISFENYDLIYTYDINLSGKVTLNPKMAAHEVTFLTKIQYKKRTKHHKAIKCPKI